MVSFTRHDSAIAIHAMKPVSLRKSIAPTPRLTLWVPVSVALALCLFSLGLLALIRL